MDKSDLILAAIEQLGRNLGARIDGTADSPRTELKADVARLEAKIDHLETRFDRLETEVRTETRVIHARLDEQRQTVNALIPSRIAAVGRGTDAAE
jgi:vacuolar-type H+-ATPase subunit I/STV1